MKKEMKVLISIVVCLVFVVVGSLFVNKRRVVFDRNEITHFKSPLFVMPLNRVQSGMEWDYSYRGLGYNVFVKNKSDKTGKINENLMSCFAPWGVTVDHENMDKYCSISE
ncbi:hypothetical protein G7062_03680 [Erysipelothrix sp. HDW6C]|uniref:hypothetical protein n=1 Tax=Erysipelothrix sp. HDW6C TaxID=2714930 RepID=UPI00140BD7C7|nr:hypothetical protein [Erysipelothrix sp. HDW6C]QIK69446.1 hypothetical protein G7062_03680 [Erysipelothrix sp. HDW6C]